MDDELRNELNRLHAKFAALRTVTARLAAHTFDEEEIRAWHERLITNMEAQGEDETTMALMRTALDELFPYLAHAARDVAKTRRAPD